MSDFIAGLGQALWQQSWQLIVLFILVWPLATMHQEKYPRFSYLLWLLIALKTAVPLSIRLPLAMNTPITRGVGSTLEFPTIAFNAGAMSEISLSEILILGWMIIVLLGAGKLLWGELGFRRSIRSLQPVRVPELDQLTAHFQIPTQLKVLASSQVSSPLSYGLWQPRILLPEQYLDWDAQTRKTVLAHELAHIQRHDIVVILFQLLLKLVFFFHPLVHVICSKMDLDRERICDELALSALQMDSKTYSQELISHLENSLGLHPTLALHGSLFLNKKNFTKRFEWLIHRKGRIMLKLKKYQMLLIGMLMSVIFVLACSDTGSNTEVSFNDDQALALASEPQTPAPTAPNAPPKPPQDVEFVAYDTPPEPLGGYMAIQKAVVYPEIARAAGIEGTVIVQAVIGTDGKTRSTAILKGVEGSGLNEAAMNALMSVEWKPALQQGQPVAVKISVPVVFRLGKK